MVAEALRSEFLAVLPGWSHLRVTELDWNDVFRPAPPVVNDCTIFATRRCRTFARTAGLAFEEGGARPGTKIRIGGGRSVDNLNQSREAALPRIDQPRGQLAAFAWEMSRVRDSGFHRRDWLLEGRQTALNARPQRFDQALGFFKFPTRALTGQHVISADGKRREQGLQIGWDGGFLPKPDRPGLGLEGHRHAVVQLGAEFVRFGRDDGETSAAPQSLPMRARTSDERDRGFAVSGPRHR
jgi:hypothetical protein